VVDKPASGGRHSGVHGVRQLIARPLGRTEDEVASNQASQSESIRHVTPWLVIGLGIVFGSVSTSMLLPAIADPGLWQEIRLVTGLSLAVYFLVGVFFVVVGVRRAYRNPPRPFVPRRSHTIAVGLLGALFLFFALTPAVESPRTPEVSRFSTAAMGFFGASAIAVVVLRSLRSPLATAATATLNILWAPFIPFGTALFVWWLVSLRKQETVEGCGLTSHWS
jgi:hypothetical protein